MADLPSKPSISATYCTLFFEYILICCPKELDNNDAAGHINRSSMQRPASSPKEERYAFAHLLNISQTSCADVAATLFLRLFEAAFLFFCTPIL